MKVNLFLDNNPKIVDFVRKEIRDLPGSLEIDAEVSGNQWMFSLKMQDRMGHLLSALWTHVNRMEFVKDGPICNKPFYQAAARSNPEVSYSEFGDSSIFFYDLKRDQFWLYVIGQYRTLTIREVPEALSNWKGIEEGGIYILQLWRDREGPIQTGKSGTDAGSSAWN